MSDLKFGDNNGNPISAFEFVQKNPHLAVQALNQLYAKNKVLEDRLLEHKNCNKVMQSECDELEAENAELQARVRELQEHREMDKAIIAGKSKPLVFDDMPAKPIEAKEDIKDRVLMPKELTAENGAKGLLIGEFSETVIMPCEHCQTLGFVDDEACEECTGAGDYSLKVGISWATIKDIYKMAVKNLSTQEANDWVSVSDFLNSNPKASSVKYCWIRLENDTFLAEYDMHLFWYPNRNERVFNTEDIKFVKAIDRPLPPSKDQGDNL